MGNRPAHGWLRALRQGQLPPGLDEARRLLHEPHRQVSSTATAATRRPTSRPGWDEWQGAVDPSTYRMWGYTLNENGVFNTYGSEDVEDPALYQTDVYRDKAVDFIRRRAQQAQSLLPVAGLPGPPPRDPQSTAGACRRAPHPGTSGRWPARSSPPALVRRGRPDRQAGLRAAPVAAAERGERRPDHRQLPHAPGVAAGGGRGRGRDREPAAPFAGLRQHLHPVHLRQRVPAGRAPRAQRQDAALRPFDPGAAADVGAGDRTEDEVGRDWWATSTSPPRCWTSPTDAPASGWTDARCCPTRSTQSCAASVCCCWRPAARSRGGSSPTRARSRRCATSSPTRRCAARTTSTSRTATATASCTT